MTDSNLNLDNLDGGGLRKELEKVLAANKELRDKVTTFESVQRVREVETVLTAKGLNPKLAKFVPAETAADPSAIDSWVAENADLFPAAKVDANQNGGTASVDAQLPPATTVPSVDHEGREAWSRIERVAANGSIQTVDVAGVESQLQGAQSPAELMAIMRQYQIS
jgi:hypothetical protein